MSRILGALFLVVACAACSPGEQLGTATTSSTGSTSTSLVTTTTSTTAATTTTLAPTTTTTTTLLEGNWADVPVIVGVEGRVLGWWDGSHWVQAQPATTLPIEGGEDYQTVVLGSSGRTMGGVQKEACGFGASPIPGVELEHGDLMNPVNDDLGWAPHGIAVSAGWDLTPHEISTREISDPDDEATASRLLAELGLEVESPRIRQAIEADLNGDGAMERLVVADMGDPPVVDREGYYSLVFHLDSKDGTATIVENSPEGTEQFPVSFRVGAIADLNGDQVMEIVLSDLQIEAGGTGIYEWIQDEGRFVRRLQVGCGA